jgi:glycosyltransferase involved in cell wall biosynthesis
MMEKYKISVIIPVFNAKDRLMPLLDNLFSQNGADKVEFIFIDDHSSDEPYQILECAASVFGNVRLMRMEKNSGPAVCRNLGIQHATGDYLCFVDDDDTLGEPYGFVKKRFSYMPKLKNNFFENMYPFLDKSDIILCRRVIVDKDEDKTSHNESPIDSRNRKGEMSQSYTRALYMHAMQYVCGSLFRRELILKHNIRFISALEPNEDIFWGVQAGYYAKRIKKSYNSVYGYHSRPDSLSHGKGEKARIHDTFLYQNRQLPLLLSYVLLKDKKYKELCRFVYEFRYTLMRLEYHLIIQGAEFHKYSVSGAFPKMCLNCERIKEVCNGRATCEKTAEFKQFIKDAAKKFISKNFDLNSI